MIAKAEMKRYTNEAGSPVSGVFPDDTSALDGRAKAHVEGWNGPATIKKFPTGQSNPTYLIEAASGRYVLRRKPPGKLLKMAHMIEREFRVLKALARVGYPAPRALALCEDEGVIGNSVLSHGLRRRPRPLGPGAARA